MTDTATPTWVCIQPEAPGEPDIMIGPFPDEAQAVLAMQESLLVQSLCEEDCIDCFTTSTPPTAEHEQIGVDLNNPDHTGQPDTRKHTSPLRLMPVDYIQGDGSVWGQLDPNFPPKEA